MYLNPLSSTGGYYYPGLYGSSHGARNKHVGGFSEDGAAPRNANPAVNTGAASAASPNLTQYAPAATGAVQPAGSATVPAGTQVNGPLNGPSSSQSATDSAFAPEQSLLTTLVGKSLEALGLISPSDLSGTNISFDSLSYDVQSSVSAGVAQQGQQAGAALDVSQTASLQGEGKITLADGTVYDFQVQLQVGDELQASASQTLGNSPSSLTAPSGSSGDGTQNAQAVSGANGDSSGSPGISSNYLAQLAAAMEQTAAQAFANDPNSFLQSGNAPASSSGGGQTQGSANSTSSAPSINWDAIQKQTSSLIDLLDALVTANQSANSGNASDNASSSASSSANGNAVSGAAASGAASATPSATAPSASPASKSLAEAASV